MSPRSLLHHARPVDLAVASGVGEDLEDRLGRGVDHAGHGNLLFGHGFETLPTKRHRVTLVVL